MKLNVAIKNFLKCVLIFKSSTVTKKYLHCNQEELFKVYKNNFKI